MRYVESNIPQGIEVRVHYITRYRHPLQAEALPKWRTTCTLFDKETRQVVGYYQTDCHEDDMPVRKIGRAIAVGRAYKAWYEGVNQGAMRGV